MNPNVGLVGCGEKNDKSLMKLDKHVTVVYDIHRKIRIPYPNTSKEVQTTSSYEKFLQTTNMDGVLISSSCDNHFTLAQKALLAGKHVYLEKPSLMLPQQTAMLRTLAQRNKKAIIQSKHFKRGPSFTCLK